MKKLFVLLVVITFASSAAGSLILTVSDNELVEGESCEGYITSTSSTTCPFQSYLYSDGATIGSPPISDPCCWFDPIIEDPCYFVLGCSSCSVGLLFTFTIETSVGDAGDSYDITLLEDDWSTVIGTITITVISAPPKTIIVNWDGSGDYTTIQAGINAADDGDTVLVEPGTYSENISFGGKKITVRTADPNDPVVTAGTVIDGGGINSTVTFGGSEDSTCVLTGFTITGGNSASSGGGIAGGGSCAAISKCVIRSNSGQNGGGLTDCDGTISNCLIYENTATLSGGGLANCDGDIVNCTIVDNTAGDGTGGIDGCNGTITNCVVWGNTGTFVDQVASSSTPNYSCIKDWSGGGTGNIVISPEFINPASDNYHLPPWSYCTDAGTNSPPPGLPATDLDGTLRPIDGENDGQAASDIGCYESVASSDPVIWLSTTGENLIIRNSGGGTLNWTISAGCSWVEPNPTSGSSSGEPNEVTFIVDETDLGIGYHQCLLTVSAAGAANSPRYAQFTLHIPAAGDFDEDGQVDCDDLRILALSWMSSSGDDNWNPVCDISDPNDEVIDGRDFGVFAMDWDGCGDPPPEPGMSYQIEDCGLAMMMAGPDKDALRFSATVEGNYILFEDMMEANCCAQEVWLDMMVEDNLITLYEHEYTPMVCLCICDWPVTATLGPFEPGIYTLDVYEDMGGFIGSTIVIIE